MKKILFICSTLVAVVLTSCCCNQKEAAPALLIERAKEAWIAAGGKKSEIKSVAVYLKPEEGMVYYVINDSAGSFAF